MMRKLLIPAALLVLLTTPLVADQHQASTNVDTVFIASSENYPDAMVASSAASKIGAPILLTDRDEVPQEVTGALQEMQPSEIILLGGEAVISQEVESSLAESYNVSRMWGVTRYGTAVEVAEYFWQEGSDSALLVENDFDDQRGNVLGLARGIAKTNSEPIFLTPGSKIPASVMNELEDLGVTEIGYVGSELSDEVESQLQELGIDVRDQISGENESVIEREVRNRLRTSINTSQQFVVVGATDYRHALAGTTDPDSNSYLIGSEDEIQTAVDFINEEGITDVRVVGGPDMVEDIAEALREGTNASITVRGVAAAQVASQTGNITDQEIASIAKKQRQAKERWMEAREQHMEQIQQRANSSLQRARDMARDMNVSDDVWEDINEAEAAYGSGEYPEAYEEAREILGELRGQEWDSIKDNPGRVRDRIRGEVADIQDHVADLREINSEFANEMSQNLSVEERLEIIQQFREKRSEAVEDLIEEARGLRGDLSERFREAERRVDGDIRTEFEQECADEDAPAVGDLLAEFSGHDGYLRAEGTLGLSTPNYRASVRDGVSASDRTVTLKVSYTDVTQRAGVGGIQCTGSSEFEIRKYVDPGNWTVDLSIAVDGEQTASARGQVMVTGDDDEDSERDDDDESSLAPMVEAESQDLEDDGSVEVEGYLNEPGFVVVHRDDGGQPGEIVGNSDLLRGEFDTSVQIGRNASGGFWAMLHYDDGDGQFTPSADQPVTRLNATVQTQFKVALEDESENETDDEPDNLVTYTSDGFDPARIEIEQGETVTWRSEGPGMWVASNEHPTHTEYDGTSLQEHCGDDAVTFDSCESEDEYTFTFEKAGEWGYHNHRNDRHEGVVVVKNQS